MSVVSYNGVTLPYALCGKFEQKALYDTEGQTDWFVQQFDMGFQAVINTNYMALVAPDLTTADGDPITDSPAVVMGVIRSRLMKPRKTLSVKFNGVELIPIPQLGNKGTVDALNGPQPQSCNITQLNNTTFLITYHIAAHYWESLFDPIVLDSEEPLNQNIPGNNILYNRWSERVDLDASQLTTYSRTGKYLIRSDNVAGLMADSFRESMVVIAPKEGCLRVHSSYTIDPSGLGMAYTVTDQEVFKFPPPGAYEAAGYYADYGTSGDAKRRAECYVKLRGRKDVSQEYLLNMAIAIVMFKLAINGAPLVFDEKGQLKGSTVTERTMLKVDMYNNEVEFLATAVAIAQKLRQPGVGGMRTISADVFTPYSDSGGNFKAEQPTYTIGGTANVFIEAARYWDPTITNAIVNQQTGQLGGGFDVGEAGKKKEP